MRNFFLFVGFLGFYFLTTAQQLIINEVSQGVGSAEYVEFVVIGNTICENDPIPCIDLRKVIFDDNNGYFAPGTGTGIASGALRFSNDNFWSCIPQGTYILVYNQADPNPLLPPDDISTTDGNCYLVLPANSPLIEGTSVSPTTSITTYPPDPQWGASTGWAPIAMANGGDSFMIPDLTNNGVPLHSVSWGNNTNGAIIYFAGSAAGLVMSFKNIVDNNPDNQANWVSEPEGNGTPGAPNSTANDLWIGTMNPTCRQNALLDLSATNASCGGSNGSATLVVNGITNYTIEWETGSSASTLNNLTAGFYTVTVTDNLNGCEIVDSVEVVNSANALNIVLTTTNENCLGSCDGNISVSVSGGQAPYTQASTLNGNPISFPNANQFCAGTYTVVVTDNNGCQGNASTIVGTAPSSLTIDLNQTPENCSGSCDGNITVLINGGTAPYNQSWTLDGNPITAPASNNFCGGIYELTVTDDNGCEAVESETVSSAPSGLVVNLSAIPESCQGNCDGNISATISGGAAPYSESWTLNGNAITEPTNNQYCAGNYTLQVTDNNGCQTIANTVVATTAPPAVEVSNDTIICIRDTIFIFAIGGQNTLWSIGATTPVIEITPLQTTSYFVQISTGACVVNETIIVKVQNCDLDHGIEFPNVFSPDGDNVNEFFIPIVWENVENVSFSIFNRWGNELFVTDSQTISWDGDNAVEGTYFYLLNYKSPLGDEHQKHGWFQLVR